MRHQEVGDEKKETQDAQPDLRPSSLLPRQFPKKPSAARRHTEPNGRNGRRLFQKAGPPARAARPIKVSGGRRHEMWARRNYEEGGREERSRRSRGQNTKVPLAALPATTVAAGGETRERERRYNRRRLLTKQRWVRASWRW